MPVVSPVSGTSSGMPGSVGAGVSTGSEGCTGSDGSGLSSGFSLSIGGMSGLTLGVGVALGVGVGVALGVGVGVMGGQGSLLSFQNRAKGEKESTVIFMPYSVFSSFPFSTENSSVS